MTYTDIVNTGSDGITWYNTGIKVTYTDIVNTGSDGITWHNTGINTAQI